MRDCLATLCREAGWATQLEVALPQEAEGANGLRPADIFLPTRGAKPLAIDVGVSHPLRPSAPVCVREQAMESAIRHEERKLKSMLTPCRKFGWLYKPACFEATGGWGPGASAIVRSITHAMSLRDGVEGLELHQCVVARVSSHLMKGVAEMFIRGHE